MRHKTTGLKKCQTGKWSLVRLRLRPWQ